MEISDKSITLAEGKKSEKIVCTAAAYPPASYEWIFNEKARVVKTILDLAFIHGYIHIPIYTKL